MEMAGYIDTDTDTVTTDSERPPNRIEIDFSSTAFEKIPLWKSWAAKGKVKEAIDQLLFLEKQTRPGTNIDTTARIVVAIVQIYFEAKNWAALNEQILRLAKKRSQPKQAIVKMVQECITFIDKIPDKEKQIRLIETLSFVTEGRAYLNAETTLLINILKRIKAEEDKNPTSSHKESNVGQNVPLNFMDPPEEREMMGPPKKRKLLDSQSKEIVYNLYKYFNEIKGKDMSSVFDTTSSKLVAMSTGIPWSNVKKVMLEGKRIEDGEQGGEFSSPKNVRKRRTALNDLDRAVVRESIIDHYYDYYNKDEVFPSLRKFHAQMKEKINYPGSYKSLRIELLLMGFHWKRINASSRILVEKNEIRFLRINFLNKIAEYRAQGRPIVYTGETFIDITHRPKRAAKGLGLVIVHAGGMDGYVPNALYMFEAQENNHEDLHYMKSEDYIKWMNNQLIPNLKPNSIVVVDNPYYQNILQNPPPRPNARKQEMLDWLDYRNIVYSSSMLKPQLYQLILQHKENIKEYKIDNLLRNYNHGVLRLPPCHPELNPIKNIWPLIKQGMEKKKDLINIKAKMKAVEQKINSISLQQWKNLCDLAIKDEKKLIGHDAAIDALTEKLDLTANDSSDESETELDIDYPMSDN
ncbi:hypothetical protein PYW07_017196 [Mythimna separata]|uniref:PSMD12/CSN4-like N-terminal domain-containing protein n=1 Tax=Mythimna separata TaxID=271217 RepID=A0AAD8DXI1_MYTSE|nr:hypothetical protein PYW07_017196 [Mythimna separata]